MSKTLDLVNSAAGPRLLPVLERVKDQGLKKKLRATVRHCAEALDRIDRIDLMHKELRNPADAVMSSWIILAPNVRELMLAVQKFISHVDPVFPPIHNPPSEVSQDIDIDAMFERLESTGDLEPQKEKEDPTRTMELEALVESTKNDPRSTLPASIASLNTMLQQEFVHFNNQLHNTKVVSDPWFLLEETDDFRTKSVRCIEAVLGTIVTAFSPDPIERLLPRYSNRARRAERVRESVKELTLEVEAAHDIVSGAEENRTMVMVRVLVDALNDFADSEAYRMLKPVAKKQTILFHQSLSRWMSGARNKTELKQALDGFGKFLELLNAVDHAETGQALF